MRLFTEGITGTTLDIDGLGVQLLDMGGIRSERKHWVHVCPHADAIVLVVSMSAFSNYLTEDIHTVGLMDLFGLCCIADKLRTNCTKALGCANPWPNGMAGVQLPSSCFSRTWIGSENTWLLVCCR